MMMMVHMSSEHRLGWLHSIDLQDLQDRLASSEGKL